MAARALKKAERKTAKKLELLLVERGAAWLTADLERAGFAVTWAPTVAAGLEALTSRRFDLVLADAQGDTAEGLSLLRQMREQRIETPTAVMLERLDDASVAEAAALGAAQCLERPADGNFLESARRLAAGLRKPTSPPQTQTAFWSRLRGSVVPSSVSATDAKNEFGKVLDLALKRGAVVITRHESPRAVLLALDEFESLVGEGARHLDTLSAEFDAMFETMQAPEFNARMAKAFGASPEQLGEAALDAARRHG